MHALLKNWVAEGVAFEVNASTQGPLITASHPRKQYFLFLFSIFSHSEAHYYYLLKIKFLEIRC